ncbi:MAG TPA: hypothetical protein VEF37_01835 [Thermodesulfovibrionales bacterium]|nr:hypothetical protein [Thermodesulfovibrionales bacterium]
MPKSNDRLVELSNELDENIIAVKGTLELVDSSVTEDELHDLLLKAIARMDTIQKLSHEMIVALKNLIDKIEEIKGKKENI